MSRNPWHVKCFAHLRSAESQSGDPQPEGDSNQFQQAGAGTDAEVGIGALSQPPAETDSTD